jgi:glutamyl-tRNA reductase
MSLSLAGINHRTAPVAIRERAAFDPAQLEHELAALRDDCGLEEALILSTCNRTEIYAVSRDDDAISIGDWLAGRADIGNGERGCIYGEPGAAAIRHTMAVACGLDSMVLGEHEILGQMKEAYRRAHQAGTTGPILNRLFQQTFATAKRVRTETAIGANAVSLAYAAVNLSRQIFSDLEQHTALLVGAGETIQLVARHLHGQGLGRMIVANRSLERAHDLAHEFDGFAIALDEIPAHLHEADIVVSATSSPDVLVSYAAVEAALKRRRRRPIFMVDLAVPRDIEPKAADLSDIYLYTVDQLESVVEENRRARQHAADAAQSLLDLEAAYFTRRMQALDTVDDLVALRERVDRAADELLDKARRRLAAGEAPEAVMEHLAHGLTRQMLHPPTRAIQRAGETGDLELLAALRRLLDIARRERS